MARSGTGVWWEHDVDSPEEGAVVYLCAENLGDTGTRHCQVYCSEGGVYGEGHDCIAQGTYHRP